MEVPFLHQVAILDHRHAALQYPTSKSHQRPIRILVTEDDAVN
jgi:hypothetical protein